MSDIITKILVEVLSVLSLATKQIKQGRLSELLCMICVYLICDVKLEKFAKKLLGESEIEDVLHRLDRLTLDEARVTGTETLQIVHGLVSNMKLVMGGRRLVLLFAPDDSPDGSNRWHDVDGRHMASSRYAPPTIGICEADRIY
jgi:hypothetical protein